MEIRGSREIARSGVSVTSLGFGGAPIGNFSVAVTDTDAHRAFEAAWDAGIRYFDTAPWYGIGLSEHRTGNFLRSKPRSEYVLSTKAGRLLRPWPHPERVRRHRGPGSRHLTSRCALTTRMAALCGRTRTASSAWG